MEKWGSVGLGRWSIRWEGKEVLEVVAPPVDCRSKNVGGKSDSWLSKSLHDLIRYTRLSHSSSFPKPILFPNPYFFTRRKFLQAKMDPITHNTSKPHTPYIFWGKLHTFFGGTRGAKLNTSCTYSQTPLNPYHSMKPFPYGFRGFWSHYGSGEIHSRLL